MFMSSSGSLTWRNAWRTASELSTAVVTGTLPPPREPSDLEYRAPDSAGAPRPGIDPTGDRPHARNSKQGRQPAPSGKQPEQLRHGIGSRIDTTVGRNQMHRRRQRRQRDAEARNRGFVLERYEAEDVFPVPAFQQRHGLLADAAFAVIDQRRISGRHRQSAPQHRPRVREVPSAP